MSDLLLGTGDGPLLRLAQAYPLLTFFAVLFTGLMIYGLMYPQHITGTGGDASDFGDLGGWWLGSSGDCGCIMIASRLKIVFEPRYDCL